MVDPIYESEINRGVPPAREGEFLPVRLGPLQIWPPVILAPMAGVTNYPFRKLCRRFGAGLYVSEMITARPLVEGNRRTLKLAQFGAEELPRSLQLYGVDPYYVGEAVRRLVDEGRVDHIDLNFGCPVPKVTRHGGGAALPLKTELLRQIVRAAVGAAGPVPVSLKFRLGVDAERLTYLQTGQIGEEEGCAAVALHARTAVQLYGGQADWEAIGTLKAAVTTIPVLGNGDIWEAGDALRMMRLTRCDGVVVGRGCLGRPWLFRDLADVFAGREPANPPSLGEVGDIMHEHARLLAAWLGEGPAMRAFRRQAAWYTKGFPGSSLLREALTRLNTLSDLARILQGFDGTQPFPVAAMRVPRGKSRGAQRVALPLGYLDDLGDATPPGRAAEEAVTGG